MQPVLPALSWRIILVALVAAFSLNGCSSNEGQGGFYIARALNLVTDSPTQTVEVGALSFQVPFPSGTGYSSAFAASGDIEVRGFVPGANPGDAFEDTLVLKPAENVEFSDASAYTIINYGTIADFRSLTVVNPVLDTVDANSNILRVVHAALGVGDVDVYVTDPDAEIADSSPLFSLSVGQAGAPQTIALADHRVRITTLGTTDVVFDSGTIAPALPGRLMYVIGKTVGPTTSPVFLNQWYNQGGSGAVASVDTPAFVRLMHLLPDTAPLDLFAEDNYAIPLASNTAFRGVSGYGTTSDTLTDGPTLLSNTLIEFMGSAEDADDGDLTDGLTWTSSIDGPLEGTGAIANATLTAGDHAVAASVSDSGGLIGTDAITVRVLPDGDATPFVSITRPPTKTSVASGTAVSFAATAEDTTDGDLAAGLSWTSSIDGLLPDMGSSITATLSPGVHAMTASVGDSNGTIGSDTVIVSVTDGSNTAPDVAITAPDVLNRVEFDVTLASDPDSLLLQNSQQVLNGSVYTFVVTGMSSDLAGTLLPDAIQNIATQNLLRVLHASSLLDSLDVYISAPGAGIVGASPIFGGLVSGGASSFGSVPGGTYDITLTNFGTDDVVLVIPSLMLANGAINTLAIVEDAGATSPDFQLFTD